LFLNLFLTLPSRTQSSDSLQWGEAIDGVQMAIADAGPAKTGVTNLRVTFRSLQDKDISLYLGVIGGWGPRPCTLDNRQITCTFNFNLNVSDAVGTRRTFKFKGMVYVAGRLDPYIAHLQSRSTYTLELGLDQFWSPETKEYELKLAPGKYQISLQFEGRAPERMWLDRQDIQKMNFWLGRLQSNTLTIQR
jgi:hypothetical protein